MAELERGVRALARDVAAEATAIERTASGIKVLTPRGGQAGTGTPPNLSPCCPNTNLPGSLTARFPDGLTATLQWANGSWAGSRTFDGVPAWGAAVRNTTFLPCSRSGAFTPRSVEMALRVQCVVSGANIPIGFQFACSCIAVPRPNEPAASYVGPGVPCVNAVYDFFSSGGGCSPLNISARIAAVFVPGFPFAVGETFVIYA